MSFTDFLPFVGPIVDIASTAIDAREKGMDRDLSRDEAERSRLFNLQEAEKSRLFSSDEARKGREWSDEMWTKTASFNAEQALINRQFQETMSSTAYQRAVTDMKKAGINPMLAFMQGGASSPSGSGASVSSPSSTTAGTSTASSVPGHFPSYTWTNALKNMVSNAVEVQRIKKDIKLAESNIAVNEAIERAKNAEAISSYTNARKIAAEIPGVLADSQYKEKLRKFEGKEGILETGVILDKLSGPIISGAMGYLLRGSPAKAIPRR